MNPQLLLRVAFLALLAPTGAAGIITGQVVDSLGVGVPNVDIDVENNGSGGDPTLSQDFTDANGFFTTSVTPDGVYDVVFQAPAPPITTHLVEVLKDVNVVGTVDLGVITLPPGVTLSGRALSGISGLPVAGVNVDVIDGNGLSLPLVGDTTDAFGEFKVAVPTGAFEVRLKTTGVAGETLTPMSTNVTVPGPTNMGDITLEQGFVLAALLKSNASGLGVEGVDLDVIDSLTGERLFTPGDDSDEVGFLDVIVPAGTFDLEFCPPFAEQLVAVEQTGQSIAAATFLGTVFLDPGVVLSGTVTGSGVGPLNGADVDVRDAVSGLGVLLCNDNTNAAGAYTVVIPTGTFDVTFSAVAGQGFAPSTTPGVVVVGNTVVNATLLPCGGVTNYCTAGFTASSCQATLSSSGAPSASAASGFDVLATNVEGNKSGLFFYGTNGRQAAPWGNGTSLQCVVPPVKRGELLAAGGTAGACDGSLSYDLNARWNQKPTHNPGSGSTVQLQLWFRDPLNTSNQVTSLSDALEFDVCP